MARKGGTPENLIPAKKGEIRNPHGRPKKLPDLDLLMIKVLSEKKEGGNITAVESILKAIRAKASRGDIRAAELLLDRGYGKLRTTNDINIEFDKLTESQLDTIINRLLTKPNQ